MERNLRLLLSYDGTDFHGWQVQPGMRTVQGVLAQSLARVMRHPIKLIGSGRTDAGVHALGQTASVRTSCQIPSGNLRHAVGSRLPQDLVIREVADVATAFHAQHSSKRKLYRYRIHNAGPRPVSPQTAKVTYHCWESLDITRMRAAAEHFVGEMDFSAMAGSGCVRHTMVRHVFRCDIERHYNELRIDVEGSGFLYNQVRNMAGTLIDVGRGRWEPDHVARILASRDRTQAGPTAPACGLCLQWVRYPSGLLRPDGQ